MSNTEPVRVLVTGAAGQISYSLLFSIANGDVFGKTQPVALHLLDIPMMMTSLGGVKLELEDCSLPLLTEVIATDQEPIAFKNIDVAILAGSMPRREGMERKDLLAANVKIFKSQGKIEIFFCIKLKFYSDNKLICFKPLLWTLMPKRQSKS